MLHLLCDHIVDMIFYDIHGLNQLKEDKIARKPAFATSKLPTQPIPPNIFSSFFDWVHLN